MTSGGSVRALSEACDAGQDFVCRSGPNEGFGILVVNVDVLADGRFQFYHAPEDAAANPLVGELGEPAFHQIDP